MTDSYIPGKDRSLESSIDTMQHRLQSLGFQIIEKSWLNPVAGVWSVHIIDSECPLLFTNGKGASRKAALASALGEFFERLSTNYFWADFYLGQAISDARFVHYPNERWFEIPPDDRLPEELLNPALRAFYDPDQALTASGLVDLNSGNTARGICALPFTRQRDQQTTYIPVNIIGNLYVSNGMSAGNTPTEARTQALSEIFERHIKFHIIAEGISLPAVPEHIIDQYPKVRAGIDELRANGLGIQVMDASLGGQYPVMCVTLLNPADQGCYASFGAHPRFDIALERALTELLQGRALDKLGGFPPPGFDLDEVAHPVNLETHFIDSSGIMHWQFFSQQADYDFTAWNFTGTTAEEFDWLCERIHQAGFDIYIMDYQHLGTYACRILVPGMSEIYQPEDLEWDNNNTGNAFRERLLTLPTATTAEWQELLEQITEQGLDDIQPVAALIGLAPDAGSLWSSLRVGELKTMLAMAIGDQQTITEGCHWISMVDDIPIDRRKLYACIQALSELEDSDQYTDSMNLLYGQSTVARAKQLLSGELALDGMDSPGLSLAGCELHQRLLTAYRKVHPTLQAQN